MHDEPSQVLLVCHVSAARAAVCAAQTAWGRQARLDVLCYGRASSDFPPPPGTTLIDVPVGPGTSARRRVAMFAQLRRRRYDVVAISQPALSVSRARGVLVGLARLIGGRRAVIVDPAAARVVQPIRLGLAVAEVARWTMWQAASQAIVTMAAPAIKRVGSGRSPRCPSSQRGGSVVYLRTDIDLRAAPLQAGGSVAHTEGILHALRGRGHEVAFWSTGEVAGIPDSVSQLRLPALLKGNVPTEVAELLSGLIQGCRSQRWLTPEGFIYQRYSLNNLAGVILSHRWKRPLILEANGSEAKWRQDFSALKYPGLAYACERLILSRAAVISAVSANAAEDLVAAGAPPERLRVVPNGVTVARFADADPAAVPDLEDRFVICFVGLFYPWHGARYLAEAFALFHRQRPDARLLLVGDGEEAPVVRAILERHGALAATHFAGLVPRTEAPRYMAAADVLVSPHANVEHFIGSPIKLFEYMAAGKAIIATRVGQIPEILRDGETALLVEPEDPSAIASAFDRLYEDRGLRLRLGAAAQEEARERHSWDARLAAILDSTRHVADAGPS